MTDDEKAEACIWLIMTVVGIVGAVLILVLA